MAPIRLTDSQFDAVLAAARPLAVGNRDAFLQAIVDALQGVVDPGDGDIHRAIVMTAHRRFWDPPLMDHLAQTSRAACRDAAIAARRWSVHHLKTREEAVTSSNLPSLPVRRRHEQLAAFLSGGPEQDALLPRHEDRHDRGSHARQEPTAARRSYDKGSQTAT
jgi:hypothetical protein